MPRRWLFNDYVHVTVLVAVAALAVYALQQGRFMVWMNRLVDLAGSVAHKLLPG